MVDLTVIQGGKGPPEKKFYVSPLDPDVDGDGFQICMITGEMGRLSDGSISRLDTPVGWVVDDGAVAEAFCAAMNVRYERDMAEIDADDRRYGLGKYAPDGGAA